MTDRRPKKRQADVPVKKIATLLALVAAGLLALSYLPLFNDNDKGASSEDSALPNPVAQDPLNGGGTSGNQAARDWQSDAKTLPKKVEGETVTAESTNYEGRRVVISDEVVEKLMKQPNVSGALPTAVVEDLTGGSAQETAAQGAAKTSLPAAPSKAKSAPPATSTIAKPVTTTAPLTAAPKVALTPVATLNAKAKNHYSIQLMGASNIKAIDKFVAEQGLAGKVWVYQTSFRGSPWYVVVQGDYASSTQAKEGIRKLSPALLKVQPWPKSFAQIQKELKQ